MSGEPGAARLAEFRALRDSAWAVVEADVAMLRNDLAARGVGERIKDKVGEEAHEVWDQARDVAGEHKGVVAGTLLAVLAWFLRAPIVHLVERATGRRDVEPRRRKSVDGGKGDDA